METDSTKNGTEEEKKRQWGEYSDGEHTPDGHEESKEEVREERSDGLDWFGHPTRQPAVPRRDGLDGEEEVRKAEKALLAIDEACRAQLGDGWGQRGGGREESEEEKEEGAGVECMGGEERER